MTTRHFGAWCERCSTRLYLQTEERREDASRNVDADTPGLDMEMNTRCPVCQGELHCLDFLVAGGCVPHPWKSEDEPRLQKEFQIEYKKRCEEHAARQEKKS